MRCYSKDIYDMYEKEVEKNVAKDKVIDNLKLEIYCLKNELLKEEKNTQKKIAKKIQSLLEKIVTKDESIKKMDNEITRLKDIITVKDKEIARLNDHIKKLQQEKEDTIQEEINAIVEAKEYENDKLKNITSKNSRNSSIPTSKEMNNDSKKTNEYNHRKTTNNPSGGQWNHKGTTLTKDKAEKIIKEKKLKVIKIIRYVDANKYSKEFVKYSFGIETNVYVKKYIFLPKENTSEMLPEELYSDVTYNDSVRSLVVILGNYFSLPYNKIQEFIANITGDAINLSQGTVDNIYTEFSDKCEDTLINITNNILNGKFQHTDETVTKENGNNTYFRTYGNSNNVLYKYHHKKGDKPIEEDNILTRFFGILITDHDPGMFKYGSHNQDCIVHFGRYCIEQEQNITITSWQMDLYNLILRFERTRRILMKFGRNEFTEDEIERMEKEYDDIIKLGDEENKYISSKYWKEKANTLLNRCKKYKKQMLFFLHDFSISYDNNFAERALRMIKGKTKVSGGFRSTLGGIRFANIMSIIKTSKLRDINPFDSIKSIISGNTLFA